MGLRELLNGYERSMKSLTKAVEGLESQSQDLHVQSQERRRSQGRIEAANRTVAALLGEKSDLQNDYMRADFDDDVAEKKAIKARRKAIDEQIAQAQENIRSESESMPTIDSEQAAQLAVALDTFKLPATRELADKVAEIIGTETNELSKRVSSIAAPPYEQQTYDKMRGKVDPAYSMWLSNEKRLQKLEDERRAKMSTASSTDAVHAQQHKRRPEPSIKVTASAYETTADGVLSGDEVARVLAEKQARKAS